MLQIRTALMAGVLTFAASTASQAAQDPALEGTWQSPCVAKETSIARATLTFHGGQLRGKSLQYFNEKCDVVQVIAKMTASYATGTKLLASPQGAKLINLRVGSFTLTPQTDDAANTLNQIALCQIKTWKRGVTTNVTGLDCSPVQVFPVRNSIIYDLYRIDAGPSLLMGDVTVKGVGISPATRPKVLDPKVVFTKVAR